MDSQNNFKDLDSKVIRETVDALIAWHFKQGTGGLMHNRDLVMREIPKENWPTPELYDLIRKAIGEYVDSVYPKISSSQSRCLPSDLKDHHTILVHAYVEATINNHHQQS